MAYNDIMNVGRFFIETQDAVKLAPVRAIRSKNMFSALEPREGMGSMQAAIAGIAGEKVVKAIMLCELCEGARDALRSLGFDPDEFLPETKSVNRYMAIDDLLDDNLEYTGPWFTAVVDGYLYRLATEFFDLDEYVEAAFYLFRLGEHDAYWEEYEDDRWVEGPDEDFFDDLLWICDSEDLDKDPFDDEDEAYDDGTIAMLDISVEAFNALCEAGIETINELSDMTRSEVLALPGMTEALVDELDAALAEEGTGFCDE